MHESRDHELEPLLRPPPSGFERHVVSVAAGERRPYDEAEWLDALVVVEAGAVELEADSGRRFHFERGDILWLTGLPLLALHNVGPDAVILVALRRAARRR